MTDAFALPFLAPPVRQLTEAETVSAFEAEVAVIDVPEDFVGTVTQSLGDVDAVIVRAPWFYGPYQPARQSQWFKAVRRGRFPLIGDGTQQRSMVYTDHLVQGLLRSEATPAAAGRAYWIADAEPYELRQVLLTVREALAAEGLPVSGGQPQVPRLVGVIAEKVDGFLQGRGRYLQPVHVLGELKDTIACDITRARTWLGWEPRVPLNVGLAKTVELKENKEVVSLFD